MLAIFRLWRKRIILFWATAFPYFFIRVFIQGTEGTTPYGCSPEMHEKVAFGFAVIVFVSTALLVVEVLITQGRLLVEDSGNYYSKVGDLGRIAWPSTKCWSSVWAGVLAVVVAISLDYLICAAR